MLHLPKHLECCFPEQRNDSSRNIFDMKSVIKNVIFIKISTRSTGNANRDRIHARLNLIKLRDNVSSYCLAPVTDHITDTHAHPHMQAHLLIVCALLFIRASSHVHCLLHLTDSYGTLIHSQSSAAIMAWFLLTPQKYIFFLNTAEIKTLKFTSGKSRWDLSTTLTAQHYLQSLRFN